MVQFLYLSAENPSKPLSVITGILPTSQHHGAQQTHESFPELLPEQLYLKTQVLSIFLRRFWQYLLKLGHIYEYSKF